MLRSYTARRSTLVVIGAAALASTHALADVTIEERMSVTGAGMMKMMNMNGRTVTSISGTKARSDSELKFESGLVRAFARGAEATTEIVRLDEDKIFSLDHRKKTYTETTFAEQRAALQKTMEQMEQGQASQQRAASGVDESECEWGEPKAEVIRSGERSQIAGYGAERISIVATQSCKNRKTGEVCDFGLVLDQWVAPEFEASAEAQAYYAAYAEKLGLGTATSRDFAERVQSFFGRYEGIWSEVAAKMREVNGYPVRSSFGLGIGGAQCTSVQQAQADGGAAPPSLGEALGGALGGVLGRKKKEAEPQPAAVPVATMPGGLLPIMSVSTELVSVSTASVDASKFEIPAGYKKAAR